MRLAETMRIEPWDPGDTATAVACYEVFPAVHEPVCRHRRLAVAAAR